MVRSGLGLGHWLPAASAFTPPGTERRGIVREQAEKLRRGPNGRRLTPLGGGRYTGAVLPFATPPRNPPAVPSPRNRPDPGRPPSLYRHPRPDPGGRSMSQPPPDDERLAAARDGSDAALGELLEGFRNYLLLVADRELPGDLRAKGGASDL